MYEATARVEGYVWLPTEELGFSGVDYLKKKLTIRPRKARGYGDPNEKLVPVECWQERDGELGVPRDFFFRTATRNYDLEWNVSNGHQVEYDCILKQEGKYAEQGPAIDTLIDWFNGATLTDLESGYHMGGMLRADPAFGKTNTTLAFLHRWGRTAVILVHKERLMQQWANRIRRYLPGARVGFCQESVCDFEDKDIVVAMFQSIATERFGSRYPEEFYHWPGVIVGDEIHRVGALTWAPVPPRFFARVRLGLTATPRRNDGCADVFWWHIGQIVFDAETERPKPAVRIVDSGVRKGPPILKNEHVSPSLIINILVRLTTRNRTIIREIMQALRSPNGRKILVLSERLEHLRTLDEMLREVCEAEGVTGVTTSFYVGEWFTGEVRKALTKAKWEMTDESREEAVGIIYKAFRARKSLKAEEEKHQLIRVREGEHYVWLDLTEALAKATADGQKALDKFDTLLTTVADEHGIEGLDLELREKTVADVHRFFRLKKHLEAKVEKHRWVRARTCEGEQDAWLDLDRELAMTAGASPRLIKEFDDVLFFIAKEYGIRQKEVEVKKALTEEQIYEAESARIMWMTYQMCSEGIDIPAADTLGFVTPISDIEQSYGRARRECVPVAYGGERTPEECEHYCPWRAKTCQGKPDPIAFDVVDDVVAISRRRRRYREQFYADVGARVREVVS